MMKHYVRLACFVGGTLFGSVGCMVCRFIPGCASGGWSGRQSCCGIPPSVCWG